MLWCREQQREPALDELFFAGIERDGFGYADRSLVRGGFTWVAGISDDGRGG